MDYQKEYANLVGQVDRVISILETYEPGDAIVKKAESFSCPPCGRRRSTT